MFAIRRSGTSADDKLTSVEAIELAERMLRVQGAVTARSKDGSMVSFRRGWSLRGAWMTGLWNCQLVARPDPTDSRVVVTIRASTQALVAVGVFSIVGVVSQQQVRIGAILLVCIGAANYGLAYRGLRRVLHQALRTG